MVIMAWHCFTMTKVPIRRLWSKREDLQNREDLLSKLQAEEHHRRELHKQSQHLLLGHPWQVHLPCRTQWFPLSGYLNEWLASWLASIQKRFSRSGSVTNFASVTWHVSQQNSLGFLRHQCANDSSCGLLKIPKTPKKSEISRYLQMISPVVTLGLQKVGSLLDLLHCVLRKSRDPIMWLASTSTPTFPTNLAPTLGSCPSQRPSPPFLWSRRSLPTILGSESQLVSPCHPRCIQECHFQTSQVASRRIYASVQNGTESDVGSRIPQFPPWSRPVHDWI